MRQHRALTFLAAATLCASACGDATAPATPLSSGPQPTEPAASPLPANATFVDPGGRFRFNEALLPAHRVGGGALLALKADQYDNTREANPEYFAITAPPAADRDVRPMVEWEPMRAVVMSYPDYMLDSENATSTFVQVAQRASEVAEVWFFVDSASAENGLTTQILATGVSQEQLSEKIKFYRHPLDSVWFIDSGPLPIIDRTTGTWSIADFRYYHERPLDDALPTVMSRSMAQFGYPQMASAYRMPLNTEGGTFQATTDGICFTGNRQLYYMSCELQGGCDESIRFEPLDEIQDHPLAVEMRGVLAEYTGCVDLIITNSITDDGTGHIDMYMKVLDDDRVLMGDYETRSTSAQQTNGARLDANAEFIEAYVKPDGGRFTVERLVMPGHRGSRFGSLPFTYINSTFINGVNLWPAYEFANWTDSRAAAEAKWQEVLPEMTHIWIDSTELAYYSGAIHCVTRTVPASEAATWIEDGTCSDGTCVGDGYDGVCRPGGGDEDVCWGPEWECACNDCESGCDGSTTPDGCDGVGYEGCCDGTTLYYCENNELFYADCGASCGWSSAGGFYDCEESGVDPSGQNPRSCDEVTTCQPDCDGRSCGDDGCGGSCGTCDAGVACVAGECREDCETCEIGTLGCEGDVAWLCDAGAGGCNVKIEVDCAGQGKMCAAGDCIERVVEEEPDAGPSDTTGADTSGGDTAATDDPDSQVGGDTNAVAGKGDDGCAASGGGASGGLLVWLASLAMALAWRRRRLPAVARASSRR